jgi:type VI secretion system protein ImpK
MRSEFACVIDPVFEAAIDLLQRVEANQVSDVVAEHAELLSRFAAIHWQLGSTREAELAQYALASWIDEMLLSIPWDGATWWSNHILEMEFFRTRLCSVKFFELAHEASSSRLGDALEVFYNCVLLGFRGMYANKETVIESTSLRSHPSTIQQWLERQRPLLNITPSSRSTSTANRVIHGAAPLTGSVQVMWWSVAAALLLASNAAAYCWLR